MIRISPLPEGLKSRDPAVLIATGLGSGRISPAPGTWGTLAAWLPAIFLPETVILALAALACAAGFWAVKRFQQKSGTHDAGMIVIDEWVGIWITLAFAATGAMDQAAASLVLFRLFDILKPWPVCYFDRHVDGAAGVMLDDIAAGVMAGFCVYGYGLWMN